MVAGYGGAARPQPPHRPPRRAMRRAMRRGQEGIVRVILPADHGSRLRSSGCALRATP
jgi:hypothetical protein